MQTNAHTERIIKAADRLYQAALYTYETKGLGLVRLILAINEYRLTKCGVRDTINQEFNEFESYFKVKE